jgi:hypothetical protein
VHSDGMSSSGSGGGYIWCLRHNRVETASNACPENYRLGLHGSEAEAHRALETVKDRNDSWGAEDRRWSGDS